jgi:hypothetical protein
VRGEAHEGVASQKANETHLMIASQCWPETHSVRASHVVSESHKADASQSVDETQTPDASHMAYENHCDSASNLNAGQTEATVGMVTSPEPISLDVFGVFGLPVTLCRFCPQYGHRIIFSRKCYYRAQCPIPILIHKMKTRAGKAVSGRLSGCLLGAHTTPAPDSHHSPKECSDTLVGVHPTSLLIGPSTFGCAETTGNKSSSQTTQNFPKVSDPPIAPCRPALNFFQRFLAWAWSRSAYNDPEMQMTNFGWRRRENE